MCPRKLVDIWPKITPVHSKVSICEQMLFHKDDWCYVSSSASADMRSGSQRMRISEAVTSRTDVCGRSINMSGDEDTELRDLVAQTLECNGTLGKIRVRDDCMFQLFCTCSGPSFMSKVSVHSWIVQSKHTRHAPIYSSVAPCSNLLNLEFDRKMQNNWSVFECTSI